MRESSTDDRWAKLSAVSSRTIPLDAIVVLAFVLVADGILFASIDPGPAISAIFGLPFLFFVPGYTVVAALYPAASTKRAAGGGRTSIDLKERIALSFGTSVALLPIIAILLSLAGVGYSRGVLQIVLSGIAILLMTIAVVRRQQLPAYQRFRVPYEKWLHFANNGLRTRSTLGTVLNVGLALAVLVSVAGVGFAVAVPNNAETYTSETLLVENDDGEFVAGDFPETLPVEGERFALQLENHEGESVSYTVIGELQRVEPSDAGTEVVERQQVLRTSTTIVDGETWTGEHTVQPEITGEDLRLIYYIYPGDRTAEPTADSAYRYTHIWVNVPSASAP